MRKRLDRIYDWLKRATSPSQLLFWGLFGPTVLLGIPAVAIQQFATPEFAADFWANYLSTALGIMVGVPFALLLDHWASSRTEAEVRKTTDQHLRAALQILSNALFNNRPRFQAAIEDAKAKKISMVFEFDTDAWDIVQTVVVQYVDDLDLHYQLAAHFSRLKQLRILHDQRISYFLGNGMLDMSYVGTDTPIERRDLLRNAFAVTVAIALEELEALKPKIDTRLDTIERKAKK